MKLNTILTHLTVVLIAIFIWEQFKETEVIVIPPRTNTKVITSPLPVVRVDSIPHANGSFEVVSIPNPINLELLRKYQAATDSLSKLQLYKDAITEREYEEVLEDSVQTITVTSKVIGTLTEQKISYRTNPITIERKSLKSNTHVYLGGFTSLPVDLTQPRIAVGVNLSLATKKNLFTIGYDTESRITAGVAFKLF